MGQPVGHLVSAATRRYPLWVKQRWLGALVLFASAVSPASATSFRALTLDELVRRSQWVVEVEVVRSEYVPTPGTMPVATESDLKVLRTIRGQKRKMVRNSAHYGRTASMLVCFTWPKPRIDSGQRNRACASSDESAGSDLHTARTSLS